MSHDLEAQWAGAALAAYLAGHPDACMAAPPPAQKVSAFSGREGRTNWPHADGVVSLTDTSRNPHAEFPIALEFKRLNEGLHGILTAIGQAHAYLKKGYAGAAIVIPKVYAGLGDAGAYASDVLDSVGSPKQIGVFAYEDPDRAAPSPFQGKLSLARRLVLDPNYRPNTADATASTKVETQWAHVREGSTEPDAFFRYLQSLKLMSGGQYPAAPCLSPPQLVQAIAAIDATAKPCKFLAYTPGDTVQERAWRAFWFRYVLTQDMQIGWTTDPATGALVVNHVESKLKQSDGKTQKKFFSGRENSIKNKLVADVNSGTLTEAEAWGKLASNFRERAHSYREDIDSGCEHLGFVDAKGMLTELGFRFVDACERHGDAHAAVPRSIFCDSLLNEGGLGAFLFYVWRLSDKLFSQDPLKFTSRRRGGICIDGTKYLSWLEAQLSGELRVLRKVSARGGQARKPFQAELAILRGLGVVQTGFRVGVGIPINWPEVKGSLQ